MSRTSPELSRDPTLGERFGLNLWRSRRRADLSQEELAGLVGLSRPHISVLERGLELPRIDTILGLEVLAGRVLTSPPSLMGGIALARALGTWPSATASRCDRADGRYTYCRRRQDGRGAHL
jgi:DNA-binding XRE family transcriptional regulator